MPFYNSHFFISAITYLSESFYILSALSTLVDACATAYIRFQYYYYAANALKQDI